MSHECRHSAGMSVGDMQSDATLGRDADAAVMHQTAAPLTPAASIKQASAGLHSARCAHGDAIECCEHALAVHFGVVSFATSSFMFRDKLIHVLHHSSFATSSFIFRDKFIHVLHTGRRPCCRSHTAPLRTQQISR